MAGTNHSIVDHCSVSWTIDEAFSSRGAKNLTLQRTLISEALNCAGHQNYPAGTEHGYAGPLADKPDLFIIIYWLIAMGVIGVWEMRLTEAERG